MGLATSPLSGWCCQGLGGGHKLSPCPAAARRLKKNSFFFNAGQHSRDAELLQNICNYLDFLREEEGTGRVRVVNIIQVVKEKKVH
jgi:hypothetical protein